MYLISIPFGTIKRKRLSEKRAFFEISIPFGTIKSQQRGRFGG